MTNKPEFLIRVPRIAYLPIGSCNRCDWFINSCFVLAKENSRSGICGNPGTYVDGNLRPIRIMSEIPEWCPFVEKDKPENAIE